MTDWNHDGRIDALDSFIDYRIYKEATKPQSAGQTRRQPRLGAAIACIITAVTIAVLILAR